MTLLTKNGLAVEHKDLHHLKDHPHHEPTLKKDPHPHHRDP